MSWPAPPAPARVIVALARAGETVTFRAAGASMWPALPGGSLVRLVPAPAADLRVGELGAYERDGWVVVHRVVAQAALGVSFAGDALAAGDGVVPSAHVLGRVEVIAARPLRLRVPRAGDLVRMARAAGRFVRARCARAP